MRFLTIIKFITQITKEVIGSGQWKKIIYSEGFFLVSFPEDYKRSYDSWTPGSLSYCEDNTRYILLLPNEPAKIIIHSYTKEEWKEIEITESKIEVEWDGKGNFKSKVEKLQ